LQGDYPLVSFPPLYGAHWLRHEAPSVERFFVAPLRPFSNGDLRMPWCYAFKGLSYWMVRYPVCKFPLHRARNFTLRASRASFCLLILLPRVAPFFFPFPPKGHDFSPLFVGFSVPRFLNYQGKSCSLQFPAFFSFTAVRLAFFCWLGRHGVPLSLVLGTLLYEVNPDFPEAR